MDFGHVKTSLQMAGVDMKKSWPLMYVAETHPVSGEKMLEQQSFRAVRDAGVSVVMGKVVCLGLTAFFLSTSRGLFILLSPWLSL